MEAEERAPTAPCSACTLLHSFHLVSVEDHQPLQPEDNPRAIGLESVHRVPFQDGRVQKLALLQIFHLAHGRYPSGRPSERASEVSAPQEQKRRGSNSLPRRRVVLNLRDRISPCICRNTVVYWME